jgi:lysophospholipase L1-like esterase
MLPELFAPPVGIANYANTGESSSSFYNDTVAGGKFWTAIKKQWQPGDWVLIQFGHNDKTPNSDPQVQANLEKYVDDAKAAGVNPILISPPARAVFSGGTLADQSTLHSAAAEAAAANKNVPFIDLTASSSAWYRDLGASGWFSYHAQTGPSTYSSVNTNFAGARVLAGMIVDALKAQGISLATYLR